MAIGLTTKQVDHVMAVVDAHVPTLYRARYLDLGDELFSLFADVDDDALRAERGYFNLA